MSNYKRQIRVFIASPSDVYTYRKVAKELIKEIEIGNCILKPIMWEDHAREHGIPQDLINNDMLDSSDILIALFGYQVGSPTANYLSGTLEEIEFAINSHKPLTVYFINQRASVSEIDTNQVKLLQAFKAKYTKQGIYGEVSSVKKFKEQLKQDLKNHTERILNSQESKILDDWVKNDIDTGDISQINNNQQILLKTEYTSLYAEASQLYSEKINITKQINGNIEATISINNFTRFLLKGTFSNGVLTGVYSSTSKTNDERGTITLKLLPNDILSGFCAFSYSNTYKGNDFLRTSPYIWVAGSNEDLLNGTYSFCKECVGNSKCCCASNRVDMPILSRDEVDKLDRLGKRNYVKNMGSHCIFQMMRNDDNACVFFKNSHCEIYDDRPMDCRLFPYDIVLQNDEYYVGYYTDRCNRELPQLESSVHILRPYFFLMYPYLHISTKKKYVEKLQNANFKVISKLTDLIF